MIVAGAGFIGDAKGVGALGCSCWMDFSDNLRTRAVNLLGEGSEYCLLRGFEKISHFEGEDESVLLNEDRGWDVIRVFVIPLVLISIGLSCTLRSTNVEKSVFVPLLSITLDNISEDGKLEETNDDLFSFDLDK